MMKPIAITFALLLLTVTLTLANDINNINILKISAAEQAIVIKNADGKLQLLKTGDMIADETRIVAFEDNHVVLEGPGEWAPVRYIVDVSAGQMHISSLARRPLEKYTFGGVGK
jgi:hypothetical protein